MDDYIKNVYLGIRARHGVSVDDVLETPELRQEFLAAVWQQFPDVPERDILHRLVYLRKKARLLPSRK
ncbi:MAG TPA: hypothetical protein VNK04_18465 [Gemmataceae bacterium]|nr:hypothetical protein [Gemmataceae bacterium]